MTHGAPGRDAGRLVSGSTRRQRWWTGSSGPITPGRARPSPLPRVVNPRSVTTGSNAESFKYLLGSFAPGIIGIGLVIGALMIRNKR